MNLKVIILFLCTYPLILWGQINVSGTVYDGRENTPLSNVRISILAPGMPAVDISIPSSSNGNFSFELKSDYNDLDASLRFQLNGYEDFERTFRISLEMPPLKIAMTPEKLKIPQGFISVSGYVLDYKTRSAVEGIKVMEENQQEKFTTNERGYYQLILEKKQLGKYIYLDLGSKTYKLKPEKRFRLDVDEFEYDYRVNLYAVKTLRVQKLTNQPWVWIGVGSLTFSAVSYQKYRHHQRRYEEFLQNDDPFAAKGEREKAFQWRDISLAALGFGVGVDLFAAGHWIHQRNK